MESNQKDYNAQDLEFVEMMIPHHEMAMKAAAKQAQKGQNKEIKKMAEDIFFSQGKQVETLKKWLKDRKEDSDSGRKDKMKM